MPLFLSIYVVHFYCANNNKIKRWGKLIKSNLHIIPIDCILRLILFYVFIALAINIFFSSLTHIEIKIIFMFHDCMILTMMKTLCICCLFWSVLGTMQQHSIVKMHKYFEIEYKWRGDMDAAITVKIEFFSYINNLVCFKSLCFKGRCCCQSFYVLLRWDDHKA